VKTRNFGDFDIHFQYVDEEPALVIKAHRFLSVRRRAYVIMQEAAWKYVDNVESPHSGHSEYMVQASAQIEAMLGLGTDIQTRFRIAEAIMDCLEDLINMKPMKVDAPSAGDVIGTLTVGNEKIEIEAELESDKVNSSEGFLQVSTPQEENRRDL
jgi:hypothetical protein